MEKIKVLQLVEDLKIGGAERIIASIAEGLERRKFEISVWCISGGGEIADELKQTEIDIKILDIFSYHNPTNILRLAYLLRKAHPDIVHTHGYFASTFGRLAAILARTPVIVTHAHTTYYGFKKRNFLIERLLSLFTDTIVCVSQAVKRFVVEVEGINEKKTSLIYNGVGEPSFFEVDSDDHVNRKSLGLEEKDIVVVTVASLTPHKGHHVLINAATVVSKRHKNLRLLIVGDGPLRNKLEAYAKELRLSSNIVFTGQRKDIVSLLKLADLFVLPSTEREGLGIALIEAMAKGLPVIGTKLGGIPEVIEDEINGLLVTPGNPYELATAIDKLVIDRSMRMRMGMNGRKIYEEKFTAQKMIKHIELLYDELLRRRLR